MNRNEKQEFVVRFREEFPKMKGIVFADICGMDAVAVSDLRRELCQGKAQFEVVKNTLVQVVLKEQGIDLDSFLAGPTSIAFSWNDEVSPAKVIATFSDKNPGLKIKGGYISSKMMTIDEVVKLSKLPGKEVLYAMFCGTLNTPLTRLMTALTDPSRKLVTVLKQIADTKANAAA